MEKVWILVEASPEALSALRRIWPDLETDAREASVFVTRPAVTLDPTKKTYETAKRFVDTANALVALEEVSATPISSLGVIEVEREGGGRAYFMAAEPARYSLTGSTVVFSARGSSGKNQPRPFSERAAELIAKDDDFRRAAGEIFATASVDLPRLFMVIEALEGAFGPLPLRASNAQWEAFCRGLGVERDDWMALRRTCRPDRHFKPHEDDGRTYTREQARAYVQHALRLWVSRTVPY